MTSTDTRTSTGVRQIKGFRPDIEGLRAVAIGLVLIYHAGVDRLPGGFVGVDVFFVISGFLITGLLIREIERSGRISLREFYARRAKRLLPASGLVLVVTAVLTWLTVPITQWRTFGLDIVGAATYVVNWVLAGRSVDYLAEDVAVSPVQHFWSLAVEEQFYIVWPLLLVLVGLWLRRRATARLRVVLGLAISLVIVPSFVWSVVMTASRPEQAFFVTTTRLWELGIGAFVAIGAARWARLPQRVAVVLGWLGLATVLASGLFLSSSVPWPGYAALAPTLGTAAVIVAGYTSGRAGPAGLLAARPAVWVGGLSYSLYLWHWPLWVAATNQWGDLGAARGLLVMAASFVPAYLSYRFVENPIRFSRPIAASPRTALSIGGNFSLAGAVAGLALVAAIATSGVPGGDDREPGGAAALASGDAAPTATPTTDDAPPPEASPDDESPSDAPSSEPPPEPPSAPSPSPEPPAPSPGAPGTLEGLAGEDWWEPEAVRATEDVPALYDMGCQVDQSTSEPVLCEFGDPEGDLTVAVSGDSKIAQWMSALDAIGQERGWRIQSYTKSACAFSSGVQTDEGEVYTSCVEWNERVRATLVAKQPDVLLTSQRIDTALADPADTSSGSSEAMVDALVETWGHLQDEGVPVVVLLDNPNPDFSVYECVAEHPEDLVECTFDREAGLDDGAYRVQTEAAAQVPGLRTVDMTDMVCPDTTCVPVIGNVLVYRQTSHLTDTYVRTLTAALAERLAPQVEQAAAG